jgi:formylglycine-generating enzyme required for sulfatase activity
VLDAFVARFGETVYGGMARTRLQELKGGKIVAVAPPAAAPATSGGPSPSPPSRPAAPAPSVAPAVGVFPSARSAAPLSASEERLLKPGDAFAECTHCPEMVVLPAGSFQVGSPPDEEGREANEGPQRKMTFAAAFAAGKYAITYDEWDACVGAGACTSPAGARPPGGYPVTNVSFEDAQAYVAWLSRSTGKSYRLLSETEREYAARAGTTTPFWWGRTITSKQANYDATAAYGGGEKGEYRQRAIAADSFAPNAFGLYQVHGNVNEWTADCWRGGYQEANLDGTPSTKGADCGRRVLRGGSWFDGPKMLRAASRIGLYPGYRSNKVGFRVARSL